MTLDKEKVENIIKELEKLYPNAGTALEYSNPFELLIAAILSAQTTDKQVNKITKNLFKKYSTAADFAALKPEELEKEIKGCGLYRNKSRNIIAACRILAKKYNGEVPSDFESLIKLPGVGRKTANVVLSSGFGKDAIAVDTHVFRVANRLGLAQSSTPLGTEKDLMKAVKKDLWSKLHHWLIYHGRNICTARNPKCSLCTLKNWCSHYIRKKIK
ncbi:MAG TPA: endonuclease III [Peptococcaceae bacterium]|nr:MAG: Endonuclease III [Clostridia bacterium 41_269]HBT20217.1 endonuclease III [Peptococcaceae bacterium]